MRDVGNGEVEWELECCGGAQPMDNRPCGKRA
jgi:hypothetical protein